MGYKKALEVLERGETPSDKEPATKPGKQHAEVEMGQATAARIAEIEAEAVDGATGNKGGVEGNLRENAADDTTPDSALFLGSKTGEELEPERGTLAAATILPLTLLGSKKAWVWIVVVVCVAVASYFLLKWYAGKSESVSPLKHEPQSVEEFMNKHYRNASNPS